MFVRLCSLKLELILLVKMLITQFLTVSYVAETPQEQPAIFTCKMAALNVFLLTCICSVAAFSLISKMKLPLKVLLRWLHRTQCKKGPDLFIDLKWEVYFSVKINL